MNNKLEQFANSGFMKKLQEWSVKLSQSPAFGTISQGMGGTMGLIMIGAVVQIICAVGSIAFGWKAGEPIYDALYMPYELTMGLLGLFMSFTLSYNYAKRLGVKATIQSGFTSMVCFILVCSPLISTTTESGTTKFMGLDMGFWVSIAVVIVVVILMNVIFWNMELTEK